MADRVPLIFNTTAQQIQELGSSDGLDLSGSQLNTGIVSATAFSNKDTVTSSITFDNPDYNYAQVGPITVGVGATIAVGSGVSYVVI
tara:strand:+ start:630 stop:890 length:261 start_codon:yes stop_codon:yes gene_type:complete